jgi:hypothetical protein
VAPEGGCCWELDATLSRLNVASELAAAAWLCLDYLPCQWPCLLWFSAAPRASELRVALTSPRRRQPRSSDVTIASWEGIARHGKSETSPSDRLLARFYKLAVADFPLFKSQLNPALLSYDVTLPVFSHPQWSRSLGPLIVRSVDVNSPVPVRRRPQSVRRIRKRQGRGTCTRQAATTRLLRHCQETRVRSVNPP